MSSVSELHNQAIELTDRAIRTRAHGDAAKALEFFEQALASELAAISELEAPNGLLWSLLHRSAGSLALDCRRFRQAEQIAATALAGDPDPEIAEELRDLLENIYFHRHLDLKGVVFQDSQLQLSLSGPEVGNGVAEFGAVYGRVNNSVQLIYRTAERKDGLEFRERGSPRKEIRENHQMLVSPPRNGSFAVTLQFGSPVQPPLPGMSPSAAIVDEFMDLIELVNKSRVHEIQEIIPDQAYLRNFLGLAKKIAPDGERFRQVGFTAMRGGTERSVELITPATELPSPNLAEGLVVVAPPEPVEIKGTLRFADARLGENNSIRVTDGNLAGRIIVPPGMMNDIVRPLWDNKVVIQAVRKGRTLTLEDIWPDEEQE
jgi:hypothetical protein